MSMHGGSGTFIPGRGQRGVSSPMAFPDAADVLVGSGTPIPDRAEGPGVLLLADGSRFEGELFGAVGSAEGELVFSTNMAGYQESLTDPSFAGQILTFTYPLIGNYGIHGGRSESRGVWPRAVVVRHAMEDPDHRLSIGTVDELLRCHGVPGIQGVDTRAITRRVREHGTLLAVLGPVEEEAHLARRLEALTPPDRADLVAEVTIRAPVVVNPGAVDDAGRPLPRVLLIDCGVKHGIVMELTRRFEVLWCPPTIDLDSVLSEVEVHGIFCSNGPGDPAHQGAATSARDLLARAVNEGIPVMGICLGHQLLGLAAGLRTYKMRYGHRGANQPVIDGDRVRITSQNHGFAVESPQAGPLAAHPSGAISADLENLIGAEVSVRTTNANDRTVEGLDVVGRPAFSVQFHPESRPGPHDAAEEFERFVEMIELVRGGV